MTKTLLNFEADTSFKFLEAVLGIENFLKDRKTWWKNVTTMKKEGCATLVKALWNRTYAMSKHWPARTTRHTNARGGGSLDGRHGAGPADSLGSTEFIQEDSGLVDVLQNEEVQMELGYQDVASVSFNVFLLFFGVF